MSSDNKSNELQEKNNGQKSQEKGNEKVKAKIVTKKDSGKKSTPPVQQRDPHQPETEPTKFLSAGVIDPAYVTFVEGERDKLRLQLRTMMYKFGEIIPFIENMRTFLSETGFNLQAKARDNMKLLNIVDKNYDMAFVQDQVKKISQA